MNVLPQRSVFQHLLHIQYPGLDGVIGSTPKQHHLRVFGLSVKTSGHRERLGHGSVTPQFVLTWSRHLAADDEVWLIKVLEDYRELRIVKHAAVKPSNSLPKLRKSHSLGVQLFDSLQRNEAIRLHAHS